MGRMHRAYSLLTVKDFNPDARTFTGIATSPTPDRMDDIIEPAGVRFKNPLPLLLYHDSRRPVGEARLAKPDADGAVAFKSIISSIDRPGTVKDRLDEAMDSLRADPPLIKGVSIGFRPLADPEYMPETGGFRFTSIEVLELSMVVIPANQDATIENVKSFDSTQASSGRHQPHVAGIPLIAGRKDAPAMRQTTTQKMTAYKATKDAKLARLNELAGSDDDTTLSAAEQEEFDGLTAEIKSINADLARLEELDQLNKAAAVPADGRDPAAASAARAGVQLREKAPEPGIRFARYAMCLAAAKGNQSQALAIAQARFPGERDMHEVLKSAVAAGTTTDPTWAGPLVQYQNFMGDFIDFLRPMTILGKFGTGNIPSLRRVPFNIRLFGQTSGGSGYWVGQGQAKPVTKFDFDNVTLRWAKVANIAVITEELARFSSPSAEALVRQALADALVQRLDTDFIDPALAEVPDVSPASITYGLTGIDSSGNDAAAVRADVRAIFAPFIAANLTPVNGVWIMSSTTALALSLMRNALGQREFPDITMMGGTFEGLPVIVSQYAANLASPAGNIVILANASDIYLADDGQVVIDVSREASLQMDSAPTQASSEPGSPNAPVATDVVSLWQTNSIGLRAERFINWKKRRAQAVAYLYDVNWGD